MNKWLIAVWLLGSAAQAVPVYRWVDENGRVIYSDRPGPGAVLIEVSAGASSPDAGPAAPPSQTQDVDSQPLPSAVAGYETFAVLEPVARDTLWGTGGKVEVAIGVSPGLQPGHRVGLYLDGGARGSRGPRGALRDRGCFPGGEHTVRAVILDAAGRELAGSAPVTFFVQQTSIHYPRNPGRGPLRRSAVKGAPRIPDADRVLQGLTTAVVVADGELVVSGLNSAAEHLLGISRRLAAGRPLESFFDPPEDLIGLCRRAVCQGRGPCGARELAVRVGGRAVRMDSRAAPLHGPGSGLVLELVDAGRDRQVRRDAELIAQRNASRRIIQQLAHEVRNPLGGLRGAAQLLARQLPDARLQVYTDVIIDEADRLASLVDTILKAGRRGPSHRCSAFTRSPNMSPGSSKRRSRPGWNCAGTTIRACRPPPRTGTS